MTRVHRLFIGSTAVVTIAAGFGLAARHAGIGEPWAIAAGVAAIFAWRAFERRTRH